MILIYCSEDGDHRIERISKEEFLKQLNAGDYGDGGDNGPRPIFADPKTFDRLDLEQFVGYILIDGDIVVPKAEKVVTKFKL